MPTLPPVKLGHTRLQVGVDLVIALETAAERTGHRPERLCRRLPQSARAWGMVSLWVGECFGGACRRTERRKPRTRSDLDLEFVRSAISSVRPCTDGVVRSILFTLTTERPSTIVVSFTSSCTRPGESG
jgi:hypothetical protein